MPFAFSAERVRYLRQHPLHVYATLLQRSERPRVNSLRRLYREHRKHDEFGNEREWVREPVMDPGRDGGLVHVVVTVRHVGVLDIFDEDKLTLALARACGYRTTADLRNAWTARHPRSPLAKSAYFILGDWRDRDVYLVNTRRMRWAPGKRGGMQGDYSGTWAPGDDEVSALTPDQYAVAAVASRQKDLARVAATQRSLRTLTEAERLAQAAQVAEEMQVNIRREVSVIADRTQRIERARKRSG